jgi:hypothetical protein
MSWLTSTLRGLQLDDADQPENDDHNDDHADDSDSAASVHFDLLRMSPSGPVPTKLLPAVSFVSRGGQ